MLLVLSCSPQKRSFIKNIAFIVFISDTQDDVLEFHTADSCVVFADFTKSVAYFLHRYRVS